MFRIILFLIISTFISSCSSEQDRLFHKLSRGDRKLEKYDGHYKENKSHAHSKETFKEEGMASWYGKKHLIKKSFHGKKTANGDKFNTDALTAAHKTLPIPSMAKITNLKNNKSVIVMINDRGPFKKERIVDVSSKVASILGFKQAGVAKVRVEHLPKETKELLDKISLKPSHGSKAHAKIKEPKCSINCFVKLANKKHGIIAD